MIILLFTKSLSYEQDFVQKLNTLGHEVLCSRKFLDDLLTKITLKLIWTTLIVWYWVKRLQIKMAEILLSFWIFLVQLSKNNEFIGNWNNRYVEKENYWFYSK